MTDTLLTVRELAGYLRVPVGTIYQWRNRGIGPPGLRVGRHIRFREADVEVWLKAQGDEPKAS